MDLFKEGQTVAVYEWDTNMFYEGVVDDINVIDDETSMMVDDIIYRFNDCGYRKDLTCSVSIF